MSLDVRMRAIREASGLRAIAHRAQPKPGSGRQLAGPRGPWRPPTLVVD